MPIGLTALLVFVPGLGALVAAYPSGRLGLAAHMALAGALGVVVTGTVAFVLATAGVLRPAIFVPTLAAVTTALWVGGLRRGSVHSRLRSLGEELRADPWALGGGLAILAGFAALRLTFPSELHFSSSTPWRYWADAAEIARSGGFPHSALQYGVIHPVVTNKAFLNSFDAGIGTVIGTEPLPAMAALAWIGSVGLAASLWALGRELGMRLVAPLLPLLVAADRVVFNTEITRDLDQFRAETLGRLVAVAGLAVAVNALRTRDRWRGPALAGALFGAGAAIHMVPVVVAVTALAWYGLGRLIIDADRRAVVRAAVVLIAVGGAGAAGVLAAAGGDIGLSGAGSDEAIAAEFRPGFDPTLFLKTGVGSEAFTGGERPRASGSHPWSFSPFSAIRQYTASATGLHLRGWQREAAGVLAVVLLLGGLVAAVAVLRRGPHAQAGPAALMAWGLGVTIAALAWVFSVRSRFYVPATFGPRRLFDYSALPLQLGALLVVEWALTRIRFGVRGRIGAVLVVAVGAAMLPTAHAPPDDRSLLEAFTWVRNELPCHARMLPNVQTEGVFEALAGRVSLLEGPIPYLRPDVLPEVVRTLMQARRFWSDPGGNRVQGGADFVIVVKSGAVGYDATIGPPNVAALGRAPNLEAVHRSPAMDVYRVLGGHESVASPTGFDCRRGPIPVSAFRGI